jgi:hypothetical protein
MDNTLKPLWYLWVPLVFFIAQIVLELIFPLKVLEQYYAENGILEILQFLVAGLAFIFASVCAFVCFVKKYFYLCLWALIAALGSFYIAGEEVSWGQHILGWGTPEFWAEINDQGETNLHNTTSWLDQKPRLLLIIGIGVGGLILPLLNKYKQSLIPQKFADIYPPSSMITISILAIFPSLIVKVAELFGVVLFGRVSEIQELYLYYFVLLYIISLKKHVKGMP